LSDQLYQMLLISQLQRKVTILSVLVDFVLMGHSCCEHVRCVTSQPAVLMSHLTCAN